MTLAVPRPQDPAFEAWLAAQLRHAAQQMLVSISPVAIVQQRPGFGQTVQAIPGAIVASPVLGAWDPAPDYFFHWFRDSAVVIDALRLLHADGQIGDAALQHLRDFTQFSLGLQQLDGRVLAAAPERRARVAPDFLQYLRDDEELALVHGDAVAAETRVNPDGTLDVSRWSRPQYDGPALRALALLRWAEQPLDAALRALLDTLIRFDLDFTLRHWQLPSFDIWEEENGHHYYTLRVAAAALAQGAAWWQRQGDAAQAQRCQQAAQAVLQRLDGYWVQDGAGDSATAGYYRSRVLADGQASAKALDIAVILSAIHGLDGQARHSPADPRMQATLARLDALFDAAYPINQGRAAGRGPALGRYAGDVYFSGGAYYFSTLGAAEFCFRAALQGDGDTQQRSDWMARGDAYLATVRAYTPASGDLSEQFDQRSGAQTSAQHLAWSYAAFISAVHVRRCAAAHLEPHKR